MSGVTATGFDRKTFEEIKEEIITELRRTIDARLVLDETTALGQTVDTIANQISENWEILEEAYYAFDPNNATGQSMVALAALTGTERRAPTQGSVLATVNLDGGLTFSAGQLVAHDVDNEANRWYNLNSITTPTGAAANYQTTFVSEEFGAVTVAAGKLTEIAQTATGWNSITNAAAATSGQAEETIEELRERRELELASSGSATLGAIIADVSVVDNVLDVTGFENTSDVIVGVIGPHGFRIVVWDDSAAANNDIAQAIHDSRSAGIKSYGAVSGNATAWDGSTVAELFDRATEKVVEVNCVISSASTVAAADVKAAILAVFGTVNALATAAHKGIGDDVVYIPLSAAPFDVEGVDDVTTFQIRFTGDAWGVINLPVGTDEVATLTTADITVTGDVT